MDAREFEETIDDRRPQLLDVAFDRPRRDRGGEQSYAVVLAFAILACLVLLAISSIAVTIAYGIWRLFS